LIEIAGVTARVRAAPGQAPGKARVCLRPEDLVLAADGIPARCRRARYQGVQWLVELAIDGQDDRPLQMLAAPGAVPEVGAELRVGIRDGWVIPESAGAAALASPPPSASVPAGEQAGG
jgi:hypothetical protein